MLQIYDASTCIQRGLLTYEIVQKGLSIYFLFPFVQFVLLISIYENFEIQVINY